MATPTPGQIAGKHPTSTPAVGATPPVSTPFSGASHLAAFSPPHGAGKSVVPSPQQFKKSPANSNTVYGHPSNSSSFGGGTGGSAGAVNFDSPSAIGALLPSLGGVGDLGNDALSGLGATGVAKGASADEAERARRIDVVLDILRANKGRVSEEGIERLARRIGLECLWETQMGSGVGSSRRTLVIAGTGLALDIEFRNNVVEKVTVSFSEAAETVTKHAGSAGRILLRDLKLRPGESPLTKSLDKFAENLERLAGLDKLSVLPGFNCHEAVAGVYESLRRLHEWEIQRLKEEEGTAGKSKKELERIALCSRSGRPVMNVRGVVGLSLDYWQERHRISKKRKYDQSSLAPAKAQGEYDEDDADKEPKTWSLVAECISSSAHVYPPVRITDKWISSTIEKVNPSADDLLLATSGPVLDWQDPENVLLPASAADPPKSEGMMEGVEQDSTNKPQQKLPDVSFIAKFNPPLVVPYSVAMQIYSSTGATLDASYGQVSVFDTLLLPHQRGSGDEKSEPDGAHRRIHRKQSVTVFDAQGRKKKVEHQSCLTVHKIEYGFLLKEVPFSHPRQLVDMLPILRQWARVATVLGRDFGEDVEDENKREEKEAENGNGEEKEGDENVKDDFAAFMGNGHKPSTADENTKSGTTTEDKGQQLHIDVSLYTSPAPRIRVTFPFRKRTGDVWFDIGRDGVISVLGENLLDDKEKGKGKQLGKEDLGRMLEIAEDLGIWVEFLRAKWNSG